MAEHGSKRLVRSRNTGTPSRRSRHATKACQLSEWKDIDALDTLAAAYAESGDFADAVKWQTKARDLAPANDKADLQSRLGLYQAHKPYRETEK